MKIDYSLYIAIALLRASTAHSFEPIATFTHPETILAMDWNEASDRLATAGSDGLVRIWNPETGELEITLDARIDIDRLATQQPPTQIKWKGNYLALVYNRAWTHGRDSYVGIWAIYRERMIVQHATDELALFAHWHPAGQRIVVATQNGFHAFNTPDGEIEWSFQFSDAVGVERASVSAMLLDGQRLVWGTRGGFEGGQGAIQVWDQSTESLIWRHDGDAVNSLDLRDGLLLSGHGGWFDRANAKVWSIQDGGLIFESGNFSRGLGLAFFVNDPFRFIAGRGGRFLAYDLNRREKVRETNMNSLGGMWTPSPDRKWLAIAGGGRGNGPVISVFRVDQFSTIAGWEGYSSATGY